MENKIGLSEREIDLNPFIQFENWFKDHHRSGSEIPDSVSLGTSSADGVVSVRTVLLKDYSENGFRFYTNYNSRKGCQLLSNPKAALLFYWPESGRQIRIEGVTEKVSEDESQAYFMTRPRESQLSAWASEQSRVIPGRIYLENLYKIYEKRFLNKSVNKPPHWGGFCLIPHWFEFWQNGEFRLHDRLTYTKSGDSWVIQRLAP